MNVWIVSGIYLAIAGLAVGIFLYGKPAGNSLFDRLYQFVCIMLPRLLKRMLERCCGKRAPAFLDKAWVYIAYSSNPLVQVFYLCVVVGGYLGFAYYGYPHIPNRYLGDWHKYAGFVIFFTCLSVWWKACRTDPGMVTPKNVAGLCEIYPWDDQIFASGECSTCQLKKPARSKHCGLCDICVCRFDHHCIWINNCVGVGNHKWFLSFLFVHLVICFYGAGLTTVIVLDVVDKKDLLNAVFIDPLTKQRHKASYMIIFQYLLATEGMLLFVAILCLIMGLVLCGFFLWHLNLVRTGTTTNELSKWNYVRWCLKQDGEEGKARLKELHNIYNKGCVANFLEVIRPIDVHRLPNMEPATSAGASVDDLKAAKSHRVETVKGKNAKKRD